MQRPSSTLQVSRIMQLCRVAYTQTQHDVVAFLYQSHDGDEDVADQPRAVANVAGTWRYNASAIPVERGL